MKRNAFFFMMAVLGAAVVTAEPSDERIVEKLLERCGMGGVSVSEVAEMENGRVVKLDLSNRDVAKDGISMIPAEIGQLTALVELHATENIIESIPPEIGRCVSLRILDFGSNRITQLPPEIGNLTKLQSLDVRHNRLMTLPPQLANCSNVEYLWLWGNKLTDIKPVVQLTKLKELYLKDNRLTTLPPKILRMKFKYIDFIGNRLCNLPTGLDRWVKQIDNKYRATQKCGTGTYTIR